MPNIKITFELDAEIAERQHVLVDGKKIGHIKTMQHGPGWLLKLDGKTWQNAPGARYHQEKDFKAEYTYCKTMKVVKQRVEENV